MKKEEEDKREKEERGTEGPEGERKAGEVVDAGRIGRGQCKLLSAVQNLRMWSWSVVENFSLNCLLISIDLYFREEYMDRVRRRQAGWESDVRR